MARPTARFRYGPTLDSFVDAAYPMSFDQVLCWRQLTPGSTRARNAAGTTDGWVTGRDYYTAGSVRWVTPQLWSPGGLGVQGFMDWATGQNPFRFVPDLTNENFYVDNCYLEEPFDTWKPGFEQANDSQSLPIVMRNASVDFAQALRSVMFEYLPGTSLTDLSAAYSRNNTGYYQTRASIIAGQSTNALRDANYQLGSRTTLLEPSSTNLLLQSELNGSWTDNTNASHLAVASTGCDNAVSAASVTFTNTANNDVSQTVTVANPANKRYIFSLWVSDASIAWNSNQMAFSVSRGDNTNRVIFTKNGGTLIATGQTVTTKEGYLFRKIYCVYIADSTTNANVKVWIQNNGVTGSFVVWGVMLEDVSGTSMSVPSSTIRTTGSQITRGADVLNFPFGFGPQQLWVYSKHVELGNSAGGGNHALWCVGGSADCLQLLSGGAQYFTEFWNNGVAYTPSPNLPTPNYGDTVELLVILNGGGSGGSVRQSLNGGADSVATFSGPNATIQNVWATPIIRFCSDRGAVYTGFAGLQLFRLGAGSAVTTIAQARVV